MKSIFNWFNLAATLGILAIHFLPSHPDRFRDQAFYVLLASWMAWSILMANQVSKWVLPGLAWMGYSGIRIFASKFSPFKSMAQWFDGPAASSLVWIVLVVTVLSVGVSRGILFEIFKLSALINSVFLLLQTPGLLDNPAEDASLVACVSPLILFGQYHWGLKLLLVAGVIASKSATGIFALMAIVIAYAFLTKRTKIALGSIPILALGGYLQGGQLISSNARSLIWELTGKWWIQNASWWKGTGLGSFEVLAPGIQRAAGHQSGFFLFAHNEWFQILFETGITGLVLTLFVYAFILFSNKKLDLKLCWIVLGLVSMTQSPLRVAIMGIWSTVLCLEMLSNEEWI